VQEVDVDATARRLLWWGLTAGVGYCASAYVACGNPRQDALAVTWMAVLLVSALAYALWRTTARRRAEEARMHAEIVARLDSVDERQRLMLDAQQQTMRSDIVHKVDKYVSRGWVTPEEHRAISDEYGSYSALGINGYIKVYIAKVDALEVREV